MVFARLLCLPQASPPDLDVNLDNDKIASLHRGRSRMVRHLLPGARRRTPGLSAHQAELVAECLRLLEERARQPSRLETKRRIIRHCAGLEADRAAFLGFSAPGFLPRPVAQYARHVLFRCQRPLAALGHQYAGPVLQGRHPVGPAEWLRVRSYIVGLAADLSLEPEPGANLAAILADRLGRPSHRLRQAIDANVISLVMRGPLVVDGPPRAVLPRGYSYVRAAA